MRKLKKTMKLKARPYPRPMPQAVAARIFWRDKPKWRTAFACLEVFGILAALVGIAAFVFGIYVYQEEKEDRRDDRITRAWQLVTTPASGNSGKREALEYLVSQSVPLVGIDLSCEAMNGGWDEKTKTCEQPVFLQGINLQGANLEGADFSGVDLENANFSNTQLDSTIFSHARMKGANLSNADMELTTFYNADLTNSNLSNAKLSFAIFRNAFLLNANFEGATLFHADFQNSVIQNARFGKAELSLANFTNTIDISTANFDSARLIEEVSNVNKKNEFGKPRPLFPIGLEGKSFKICRNSVSKIQSQPKEICISVIQNK